MKQTWRLTRGMWSGEEIISAQVRQQSHPVPGSDGLLYIWSCLDFKLQTQVDRSVNITPLLLAPYFEFPVSWVAETIFSLFESHHVLGLFPRSRLPRVSESVPISDWIGASVDASKCRVSCTPPEGPHGSLPALYFLIKRSSVLFLVISSFLWHSPRCWGTLLNSGLRSLKLRYFYRVVFWDGFEAKAFLWILEPLVNFEPWNLCHSFLPPPQRNIGKWGGWEPLFREGLVHLLTVF